MDPKSGNTDAQRMEELKNRQSNTIQTLQQIQNEISQLPQPLFTSIMHKHVYDTCIDLGLSYFTMKRAPPDYYEWTLEQRRDFLGASSIHQLCKTILMENTKGTRTDCEDKNNSRFYAVIIQYTSRLDTQMLFKFVRGLIPGSSRNHYHFRSAKPEDVTKLTNAEFNGVCPVGNKVNIPVILSARLTSLPSGFMYVGGGEPELKLGFGVDDFVKKTGCFVADIAVDGRDDDNPSNSSGTDTPIEPVANSNDQP